MATFNYTIDDGTYDGRVYWTVFNNSGSTNNLDSGYDPMVLWWFIPAVTIANGSTISSATFTFRTGYKYSSGDALLYGADEDDVSVPGQVSDITNLNETTAQESVTINTAYHDYNVDATDIVQEIVDRGGWSSGNDMMIMLKPAVSSSVDVLIYAYEYSIYMASISVTYTEGSSDVNIDVPVISQLLSMLTPSVARGRNISIPVVNETLSVPLLQVSLNANVDVPKIDTSISTLIPGIARGRNISLPSINQSMDMLVPTIARGRNINVPAISHSIETKEPTISLNVNIDVPAINLSLDVLTITAARGRNISMPVINETLDVLVPVINTNVNIDVPAINMLLSVLELSFAVGNCIVSHCPY